MNDMQEITDLRPAPRTTPAPLMWLMAVVVTAGAGILLMTHSLNTEGSLASAQSTPRQPTATDAAIHRAQLAASAGTMYWPLGTVAATASSR